MARQPVTLANSPRFTTVGACELFHERQSQGIRLQDVAIGVYCLAEHEGSTLPPGRREESGQIRRSAISFPSGVAFELPIAYSGLRRGAARPGRMSWLVPEWERNGRSGRAREGRMRGRASACCCSISTPALPDQELRGGCGPGVTPRRPPARFPGPGRPSGGRGPGIVRGEPSPRGIVPFGPLITTEDSA